MTRALLVYNPTAGEGSDGDDCGDDDVRKVVVALEAEGHDVVIESVKDRGWERALDQQFELVVAAGGDGTVGKVFEQLAGRRVPAAIAPFGSANNIARSLKLSGRQPRRFDICSLAWDGGAAAFVESAGGGVFAEMVARAEHREGDKVELGLRNLLELAREAPARRWRVEAEGVDLSGEFVAVEVLNVALLGPNVPLAPNADPDDGVLDLVLVRAADAAALAGHARARLEQRRPRELRLETHRARRILLGPPPHTPMRLDGELLEWSRGPLIATVATSVDLRRSPL